MYIYYIYICDLYICIYICIIYIYIYVIMQPICPSGYYQNGVVTTQTLRHMMFVYTLM